MEDFHTKAVRLVTLAGYEGATKDRVLRDTIISGITSDKIRAKIVKEGHEVSLNLVMEIARLEVATQHHLDRMQETTKVNYVQYGKSTKSKKGKKSTQSGASGDSYRGDRGHGTSSKPGGKGKKLPFPQDTCYRCGKGRHQKVQDCKALDVVCRGCGKKGHFEKACLKGKHSTHSLEVPEASNNATGEPLYFSDDGQPVYAHMVSVHANKHLIKFPIDLSSSHVTLWNIPQILLNLKQNPAKLENHFLIAEMKEVWKNCLTVPTNVLSQRSNFKVVH